MYYVIFYYTQFTKDSSFYDAIDRTKNAQLHPSMIKKSPSIRIIQYRPSLAIQLFLRISNTPHLIFNSSFSCTESNGPLPNVLDLDQHVSVGTIQQCPTSANTTATSHNNIIHSRLDGIFTYFIEKRLFNNNEKRRRKRNEVDSVRSSDNDDDNDDDITLLTNGQKAERKALMSQYHELGIILKSLRYCDDLVWEGVYKRQCIKAHLYPNGDPDEILAIGAAESYYYEKRRWSIFTWFQIWAERIVARKEVELDSIGKRLIVDKEGSISGRQVHVKKALAMAREIYSSLDWKLEQSSHGTLLDSEQLSLVDILLFGHLAEALCDIYLVTVLVDYKHVITFFQTTYETYFGKNYEGRNAAKGANLSWIKWNDRVNALNQFNRIPMNDVEMKIKETLNDGGYQDAIKIMQSIALHCHDLQEVLADVALLRNQEEQLYGADNVPKSMVGRILYKLRMGGELEADDDDDLDMFGEREDNKEVPDKDDMTKRNEQLMKKVLREAKRNDELWISVTVVAAFIGLFASKMSGS